MALKMSDTQLFKMKHTFEERKKECARILAKYPDRIPIICERHSMAKASMPYIDKTKYLIPTDLNISQFIYVIRKRINLPPEEAIFLYIRGTVPSSSTSIAKIYDTLKDDDGFLYVKYTGESTFGCP